MQLRQLAYFAAVVEHGSFSQAAGNLYIAQSSLSQSVQALEQELGFALLKRGREGVTPTEMGTMVYRDVKELLSQVNQLNEGWREAYQSRISLSGNVRLASVPGAHPILMKRVLEPLKESYPNIRFKVQERRGTLLLDDLAEGRVDLIVSDFLEEQQADVEAFAQTHGLELTILRKDAYKIAAGSSRALAARGELTRQDVAGLSLACYSGGDAAADKYFEQFFDSMNSVEYTSIEKMIQAAIEGPGVSVLPELTIRNSLTLMGNNSDALEFMDVEGFCVPFMHFVGVKADVPKSKELEIVMEHIRRVFQEELN